jgi:hypothetical protein
MTEGAASETNPFLMVGTGRFLSEICNSVTIAALTSIIIIHIFALLLDQHNTALVAKYIILHALPFCPALVAIEGSATCQNICAPMVILPKW